MNLVDSQLSKPLYPTFSQLVFALNNHELVLFLCKQKPVDNNLALLVLKMVKMVSVETIVMVELVTKITSIPEADFASVRST